MVPGHFGLIRPDADPSLARPVHVSAAPRARPGAVLPRDCPDVRGLTKLRGMVFIVRDGVQVARTGTARRTRDTAAMAKRIPEQEPMAVEAAVHGRPEGVAMRRIPRDTGNGLPVRTPP